ncbi:MAG: hypothetical protein OEY67_05955 [Gammaproteobacteria bacterium]|nr:hypothetical protein [Gammaproteobacteria bacterium]
MKTIYRIVLTGLLSAITCSAFAVDSSRVFFEQTAHTLPKDSVSVDLEYSFISSGLATGVRGGAFGGEVMLNTASDSVSGFAFTSIGYKASLQKGFSLYGVVSYFDDELSNFSATDFAIGGAFTVKTGDLQFNINPELVTDDTGIRGGDNTIFVKGSAMFNLKNTGTSLIAEVILENNDFIDTVINLGGRWQPKNNVYVDLVLYSDAGDFGATTGIPGYVIVNVKF